MSITITLSLEDVQLMRRLIGCELALQPESRHLESQAEAEQLRELDLTLALGEALEADEEVDDDLLAA